MDKTKVCTHLLDELSNYLDGDASQAVCDEIELHLLNCTDCRVVVDTLRQTIRLYHTLPKPDMPDRLRESLYESLDLSAFLKEGIGD